MDRSGHLRLMARYNSWMNDRLLDVAAKLNDREIKAVADYIAGLR